MSPVFKRGTLILFLLTLSFITPLLNAQQYLEKQLQKGDSLFSAEEYFDAVTEYKRLLFFDSLKRYEYTASFKIGLCYKAGGKWDESILYFTRASSASASEEEKYLSRMQIIRTNILRRTIPRALELLDEMEKKSVSREQIGEINYWRGWAYMFWDRFGKASEYFALSPEGGELKKLCDKGESEKYSVTFAKVFSYILPGAGQFYTGEFLSGALSLAWNTLFGYLTVNSFIENRIFDGIATGSLLFLRFYRGNIQNAGNFAIEKNLEITNKTLLFIQNNYKGIKP